MKSTICLKRIERFGRILFLLVILIAASRVLPVYAAGDFIVSFSSVTGKPGEDIVLQIKTENNPGFAALTVEITYDSSILTPASVSKNENLPGFMNYNLDYQNLGAVVRAAYINADNYADDGNVFSIVFRINENVSEAVDYLPLLSVKEAVNSDLSLLTATVNSGTVSIVTGDGGDTADSPKPTPTPPVSPGSNYVPPSGNGTNNPETNNNGGAGSESADKTPSFSDVPSTHEYFAAVEYLYEHGLVLGTGDGKFSPYSELNRAQFVIIMLRAFGIEIETNLDDNFSDCADKYYSDYLATAMKTGIVNGVGDNRFAPEKTITRQELYTLLYRSMVYLSNLPELTGEAASAASDAGSVADWAAEAVGYMVGLEIVLYDDNRLMPQRTVTRIEMAEVFYRLHILLPGA